MRKKDDGYIGRRMLRMEHPGKMKQGRPKRRCMDAVREDKMDIENTLWRPLMGEAERGSILRSFSSQHSPIQLRCLDVAQTVRLAGRQQEQIRLPQTNNRYMHNS